MHACGHDGHMAVALITAKLVAEHTDSMNCNVVFLFQPAEEATGAQLMIDEGALENPNVDEIYGFHIWPNVPKGKIGIKSGPVMAMMRDIDISIFGKSAHGAQPELGIDAIAAASAFIMELKEEIAEKWNRRRALRRQLRQVRRRTGQKHRMRRNAHFGHGTIFYGKRIPKD